MDGLTNLAMNETGKNKRPARGAGKEDMKQAKDPEWASGLKRLYDSVVSEPLPDSFKDLLSKLDAGKN